MRILILLTVCAILTFLNPSESLACLCKSESPRRAIKRLQKESTAIFVGTVKTVTKEKLGYRATLIVQKLWKYPAIEEITVQTEGGCMAWFDTGRVYLVYALKDDFDNLKTNVCMRTRLVEYAAEDLKRLGKPDVVYDAREGPLTRGFELQKTPDNTYPPR